jgi:hypothetical protein
MVISCSADNPDMDSRNLYVWGECDAVRWFPDTNREAIRRIALCKSKTQCVHCDAEIHRIEIKRTKRICAKL